MNKIIVAAAAGGVLVLAAVVFLIIRRFRPRPLKTEQFQTKWRDLQKKCADKKLWKEAVFEADALLDEALRKKRIRGKNMGERLVKAQRLFSDNDSVWFGHKLRNKTEADPKLRLKERDVKDALFGIRQALKDLGALK